MLQGFVLLKKFQHTNLNLVHSLFRRYICGFESCWEVLGLFV